MLVIKAIVGDTTYLLPDILSERKNADLITTRQGIEYLFNDIIGEFPGHSIEVIWDANNSILTYNSETIPEKLISELLYEKRRAII